MIWQDALVSIGQFVMSASILPAIWRRQGPPLVTSLMTGGWLIAFGVAFATLHLWLSAAGVWTGGACWLLLALRRQQS